MIPVNWLNAAARLVDAPRLAYPSSRFGGMRLTRILLLESDALLITNPLRSQAGKKGLCSGLLKAFHSRKSRGAINV